MSLICAVPSYAELSAAIGQDVVVINGHRGARLRLDEVVPLWRGGSLYFRAELSGDPASTAGTTVRDGIHLSRVGDFLVRLHVSRVPAEDGKERYEAHAQAHLDEMELRERIGQRELVAV